MGADGLGFVSHFFLYFGEAEESTASVRATTVLKSTACHFGLCLRSNLTQTQATSYFNTYFNTIYCKLLHAEELRPWDPLHHVYYTLVNL